MECNVGKTEGIFRMLAGAGIISLGIMKKSWWGVIGLSPLITGFTGYCPISKALGVSTCKNQEDNVMNSAIGVNSVSELLHLKNRDTRVKEEEVKKTYATISH